MVDYTAVNEIPNGPGRNRWRCVISIFIGRNWREDFLLYVFWVVERFLHSINLAWHNKYLNCFAFKCRVFTSCSASRVFCSIMSLHSCLFAVKCYASIAPPSAISNVKFQKSRTKYSLGRPYPSSRFFVLKMSPLVKENITQKSASLCTMQYSLFCLCLLWQLLTTISGSLQLRSCYTDRSVFVGASTKLCARWKFCCR